MKTDHKTVLLPDGVQYRTVTYCQNMLYEDYCCRSRYSTGETKLTRRGQRQRQRRHHLVVRLLAVLCILVVFRIRSDRHVLRIEPVVCPVHQYGHSRRGCDHGTAKYPSDPNVPTVALARFTHPGMGFYNQQMAFTGAVMMINEWRMSTVAAETADCQILLPSLVFLDYLGSNDDVEFDELFDVQHWNTYSPRLPRIVSYDNKQHYQYNITGRAVVNLVDRHDHDQSHGLPTHPYHAVRSVDAFGHYMSKFLPNIGAAKYGAINQVDQLILSGALRPAPAVRAFIERIVNGSAYAAMHFRFEQDFLCHPRFHADGPMNHNMSIAVTTLEQSIGPNPPFDRLFIAINRPLLEDSSKMDRNAQPSVQQCEAERKDNLDTLNRIVRDGMWGGRVQVFERPPLPEVLQHRPVLFASLIDSEICLGASVFIGKERSTFSINILRRRIIMGRNHTYFYPTTLPHSSNFTVQRD